MTGGGAAEPGQAGYCGRTSDLLHLSHLLCHLRKQGARETQSCPLSYNNYSLLTRLASSGVEMQALYEMSPTQSFAGGWGLRCIIAGEILTLLFSI
ncbi:mCG1036357 [Mus musculus]|nr:mCG1036357 [Mus musculus]